MIRSLNGHGGELWWAWHAAAVLETWALTATDTGWSMTADVISHDAFRVEQQPLTFRVPRQNGVVWKWPVVSLHIAGGRVSALLGPQE